MSQAFYPQTGLKKQITLDFACQITFAVVKYLMLKKCPYCFEIASEGMNKCPVCLQFIIDPLIDSEYKSIDKKKCFFCGKNILKEARICRFCHQWIDEVDRTAGDIERID